MTKVLILGANGQLARNTTRVFLEKTDVALTLYLRRSSRLQNPDPSRVKIVEGDVLDAGALRDAMRGQDVVYANLVGDMARQARAIIDAMHAVDLMRLIFVSSMGIYGEVARRDVSKRPGPVSGLGGRNREIGPGLHHSPPGMVYPRQTGQLSDHAKRRALYRVMTFRSTACPT